MSECVMMMMMSSEVVKIERDRVAACMTCPLCDELYSDATTISECLHTFCRKCIYEKITDEELDCCPICNTELGCAPLEKLRADHSLQDLRAKIFPPNRKNLKVPEAVPLVLEGSPSVPAPGRRKERSLSSLVINTPKSSIKTVMTGKRSKYIGKKNSASVVPVEEEPIKKQDNPFDSKENAAQALTNNIKGQGIKSKLNGDENNSYASGSGSAKPRRLQGVRQKRAVISEDLNVPAQSVIDTNQHDGICTPIWFSLVASDDQEGDRAPLPQISSRFLRVKCGKDGRLAVSTIKKYVAQKLGLSTEAEVEIFLYGQALEPSLQIRELVEWWLEMAAPPPSQHIHTTVGSSAKDLVMVLSYARKSVPP